MIHEFFAVTTTSIYRVKDCSNGRRSEAVKIALRGKSKFPVGHKLQGGTMIAICKSLIAYVPEGGGLMSQCMVEERQIEKVTVCFWGDQSSPIVALFKNEASARACFEKQDLQPCDPRWLEKTREVLAEIGEEHPAFYISRWDNLALIPA